MHGARHVAAADRSVGTARTRRETDDHPLRAAGAEAAGPKPKPGKIRNRTVACATSPPACRASEARVPLCVQHADCCGPPPPGSRMAGIRRCDFPVPRLVGDGKLTRNSTGTSAFQCAPGFEYFFDVDRPVVTGSPPAQESLSRLARGQGHRRGETPTPVSAPLLVAFSLVSRRKCPVLYAFSIEAPPGSSGPGAR